ncbi:MAG: hypothetical protein D6766_08055 [Verrucomicrobia bacterium]|nr:MAG: hypothetical protein D6766_08055 [Verrucomicrobiota bacterium]
MVLRISLIVAILASIGSLLVSHLQVAKKIAGLETTLSATQAQLAQTQSDLDQARADLQQKTDELDRTQRELDQTNERLAEMTRRANQQQARADRAEQDLNKTRTELTAAQRDLAAWKALGIPVDEVRNRLEELVQLHKAYTALEDENALLLRKVNELNDRLAIYELETPNPPPPMPGVKGKVVAVDPKWDFVVLDIGGKEGALQRGELLISRDGKLVAKVRIIRVEDDYCVANVLPEWKQADVQVGDIALY